HAAAARALGALGYRVTDPEELAGVLEQARRESGEQSLPALVEVFTERETNIAMGPEIDQIREFD
ncbi:MAG TPA: glyoxylate carboligase, partial [Thermoleophilia bacterium]|nr:glyoxylate carboligase [Thermoleophilia bacterium]